MISKSIPLPKGVERRMSGSHLLLIGVAWMSTLFIVPILLLFIESLNLEGGGNIFEVYSVAMSSVYLQSIVRSFYYGFITMAICIPLAYALSYFIVFRTNSERVLLALVIIPFWVAYIIRYIGIQIILSPSSPLVQFFGTDFGLLFSTGGVIIGLTSILLPFAILPIYNSLKSIDEAFIDASRVLGATQVKTVYSVILPLSLSGVVAGGIIVFILGSGSFLAPALLGGTGDTMIANQIQSAYSVRFNIPLASALAIIYTLILTTFLFVVNYFVRIDEVLWNL